MEITTIVIDKPQPDHTVVVSVADFGASPSNSDNYAAFQAAIDYSKNNEVSKLIVPTGIYHFTDEKSLTFQGLTDFVFDGQGSELIFSKSDKLMDDFEDGNASGWSETSGSWTVAASGDTNVYKQTNDGTGVLGRTVAGDVYWTNYYIQADITPLSISNGNVAVNFRYTDSNNYYSVELAPDALRLRSKKNGVSTVMKEVSASFVNGTTYRVKVNAGVGILVTVNGVEKILQSDPQPLTSGKVGLGTYQASAAFDNVKVSNIQPFIQIGDCTRVEFKNMIIDWDWDTARIATLGEVIAVNGNQFDMEFPDIADINTNMTWPIMYAMDPTTLTSSLENAKTFVPSQGLNVLKQEKIGSNQLRITNASALNLTVGELYLVRHYDYQIHAIVEQNSSHLLFDHITIYSNPGNGILLNENTHHWGIVNSKVELRPGTNRRITIAAGAIDVRNTKGYGFIKNSEFGFNGDDIINIHDNTSSGLTIVDSDTITATATSWKVQFKVGHVIEFLNADYSPTGFSSEITALQYNQLEKKYTLTFADDIPSNVEDDSILADKSYDGSNYVIRNNVFYGTRVRGILLHAGNGLIEYNTFSRTRGAAIQLQAVNENRWSEGRGSSNTIIRHNVFDTANVQDMVDQFGKGIIYVGTYLPDQSTSPYSVHKNILIENNVFKDQPGKSIFVASSENVTIRNNTIMDPTTRIANHSDRGKMWVELAFDVSVQGNRWKDEPYRGSYGVDIDPDTVANMTDTDNVLLKVRMADDFEDGDAAGWTEESGTWTVDADTSGNKFYKQSASSGSGRAYRGDMCKIIICSSWRERGESIRYWPPKHFHFKRGQRID